MREIFFFKERWWVLLRTGPIRATRAKANGSSRAILGPSRAEPNLNGSCWAGPNLIYSSWVRLRSQTQSQYILKNKYKKIKKYEFEIKKTIKKNNFFFKAFFEWKEKHDLIRKFNPTWNEKTLSSPNFYIIKKGSH